MNNCRTCDLRSPLRDSWGGEELRFWIARVGAALWLTAILVGSLAPADDVQGAYVVPDFWVHAAGYFGLAVLFMLSQRRPRLVLSAAAAVGVGVVVELLQSTTTDQIGRAHV